jgi:hypothetical protein
MLGARRYFPDQQRRRALGRAREATRQRVVRRGGSAPFCCPKEEPSRVRGK